MKLKIHLFVCLFFFIFGILNLFSISDFGFKISPRITRGAAPAELKDSISQKAEELKKINFQIQETQKNLEETQEESLTLKKEVSKINNQLKSIELNIKSSEVLVEKFSLEIDSLQYDIIETEDKIQNNKEAIAGTLRELQTKSDESPFIIFLKNKSLAESVFEIQGLTDLSDKLSDEIDKMQNLKIQLNEKFDDVSNKKSSKEIEGINLKNKKVISGEIKKEKENVLEQTKNQEKIYQKTLSELEKLREEIADEIDKMEEELRLKIAPTLLPIPRPGVLGLPILIPPARGTFSSEQKHGFTRNRGKRYHNGLDFGAPIGTPILAAESGKIIAIGDQDNYRTNGKRLCYRAAYGKFIMVKHENNLTTMYAHLSLWSVKVGDEVKRGDIIGYSGNTGRSTGPHLHFIVYSTQTIPPAKPGFYEGTTGSRVCGPLPIGGDMDPQKYLDI